jgi:NAD(P)-dependent dehydrogenase (short-subunit alcohol dehydrogenase family)
VNQSPDCISARKDGRSLFAHPLAGVDRLGDMETERASIEGRRFIVTGGSRGLGLGIVEALVERGGKVTVVARDAGRLAEVQKRLGVSVTAGEITDAALAANLLREVRPDVVVLNAGMTPAMGPLHQQTWETFTAPWETDVKGAFHWIQAALRLPLARGSRVLVGSSGAAVGGSPLSGGYAGAKRMQWLMAGYANTVSAQLDLGIRFQALIPMQIVGDTDLGRNAAEQYARSRGMTTEAFLASFGAPMPSRRYGEHVIAVLTDPKYASVTALGLKGEGIRSLDA